MLEWIRAHETLLWWLGALSVVTFVATLGLLPLAIIRIPADYFSRRKPSPDSWAGHHPLLRFALIGGKNLLGVLFLLAGVAMLVLPGQGIITILIGLTLLDFPGKRKLELRLIRIPAIHRAIDWIRRRSQRPPLQIPPPGSAVTPGA
ncbi:MAG: PGPGW domain-containing protein [Planctomycetota bacterium]